MSRDRDEALVERIMRLMPSSAHSAHFDRTGQHGAGCEACAAHRDAAEQVREALHDALRRREADAGDTARLDWLGESCGSAIYDRDQAIHAWHVENADASEWGSQDDIRDAIDTAMRATPAPAAREGDDECPECGYATVGGHHDDDCPVREREYGEMLDELGVADDPTTPTPREAVDVEAWLREWIEQHREPMPGGVDTRVIHRNGLLHLLERDLDAALSHPPHDKEGT